MTANDEAGRTPANHRPLPRVRRELVWLLALIPFFLTGLPLWDAGPKLDGGDYAHYLMHARALAEGRAYDDIEYIFTQEAWVVGPRVQPPGLPLLLAPLHALGRGSLVPIHLATVLLTIVFLLAAGRYVATREGLALGLGVTAMLGAAWPMTEGAGQILTDLPFCALVWGLIHIYDREGPWTPWRILLATGLGAAVMSFRTAGLVVVPAVAAYWLVNRARQGWRPVVPLVVWTVLGAVASFVAGLSLAVGDRLPTLDHEIIDTVFRHLLEYRLAVAEGLLYPLPGDLANDVYHVVVMPLVAIGMVEWLRRSWRSFAAVFAAAYGGMLLVVPVMDRRYLWPLIPLVVFAFLNGWRLLLRMRPARLDDRAARAAALGLAILLLVSSLLMDRPPPRTPPLASRPTVVELFTYLSGQHTARDLRVAFVKPRILGWETRIPAMATFYDDPDTILAVLRRERITDVVLGDYRLSPRADRAFRAALALEPEAYALEFENPDFQVYRYVGD